MGHHSYHHHSISTDLYGILSISKASAIKDMSCKAYKCFVNKWYHDHRSLPGKTEEEGNFKDIDEAHKTINSKKQKEGFRSTIKLSKRENLNHLSVDDSFFSHQSSFLSKSSSRRSHTPQPRPTYLSNSSSRKSSPFSLSRTSSSLSRSMSRSCTSETEACSITKSTSRRSTTPIIFSQSTARRKPSPVEKMLECTLEELFEGKGDEKPGYLPADIIFVIQEKRHPLFRRQGDDLEIAVEIPLVKALTGCSLSVPLLGGETMSIHFSDIIYPGYEKVIQGQGMPNAKGGKRGDLRITFFVNFPMELTDQQRSELCNILEDCS